jgi:hypothetical protein
LHRPGRVLMYRHGPDLPKDGQMRRTQEYGDHGWCTTVGCRHLSAASRATQKS